MTLADKLNSSRIVFLIAILLAVLAGFAIAYLDFVESWGLLLVPFGILLLVPFVVPMLSQQRANFLEPIYIVVFGYALFLFVRPIYILAFDDYDMILALRGDPQKIPLALAFAILGLVGIYIGYYSRFGTLAANTLPTIGRQVSSKRMRNWGLLLIVLGTTLYALYLRQRAGTDIASATPRDPRDPIEGGTGYFTIGLQLTGAGI